MKLSELSGAHIGSQVTVKTPLATITGTLFSVSSVGHGSTQWISDGKTAETTIFRREVDVKLGSFEARNLDGDLECEVHEK